MAAKTSRSSDDAQALDALGLKAGQRVTYTPTGETGTVLSAYRSDAASKMMVVVVEASCGGHMHVRSEHVREAKG